METEIDTGAMTGLSDPYCRSDRSLLAAAIRRGWQISADRKRAYFAALDASIRAADPTTPEGAMVIAQCNRILQLEQAAALKDLHVQEDRARMDAGKPTQVIAAAKPPIDHDMIRKNILEGIDSDQ